MLLCIYLSLFCTISTLSCFAWISPKFPWFPTFDPAAQSMQPRACTVDLLWALAARWQARLWDDAPGLALFCFFFTTVEMRLILCSSPQITERPNLPINSDTLTGPSVCARMSYTVGYRRVAPCIWAAYASFLNLLWGWEAVIWCICAELSAAKVCACARVCWYTQLLLFPRLSLMGRCTQIIRMPIYASIRYQVCICVETHSSWCLCVCVCVSRLFWVGG